MKTRTITAVLATILCISCNTKFKGQSKIEPIQEVSLVKNEAEKKVDVMIDGKPFTTYWWPDDVMKPVLYPVYTSAGTEVTRGFPVKPRVGERTDHPHHVGIWLNYGYVNGYDFWGTSNAIPEATRKASYGLIKHLSIDQLSGGKSEGSLATSASWETSSGKELLSEKAEYRFIVNGATRMIDRITTLTASNENVSLKDTKEGMFAIRVARELELPSKEEIILTDAKGNPETVKKMTNEAVSGAYRSSEGIINEKVWGTRAKWMTLYGNIGDEKIAVVMLDHPKNPNYPTYWHARDYGLFSLNPFGVKDFTEGKQELNYSIPAGKSIKLRYRVIIHSGSQLSDSEIEAFASDFSKKY